MNGFVDAFRAFALKMLHLPFQKAEWGGDLRHHVASLVAVRPKTSNGPPLLATT